MSPVIKVQGLSKRYTIGGKGDVNQTFREMLAQSFSAPFRRLRELAGGTSADGTSRNEEFWALKDVNFEVQQGEVIGIVGRNGAGKSTLLKILSRITEPTEGRVEIRGRVASLLEVGTGFHPELTGHENIYLNGAILGMSSNEISSKFDEIVAFAEVEQFINTPVKRYSSGMYVRLAFSVAAHLEPEILVVDEVLAVGDAAFQKKCLGKMDDVSKEGRTVLFVSHNIGAVMALCARGILLSEGAVVADEEISEVVERYVGGVSTGVGHSRRWEEDKAPGDSQLKLLAIYVSQHDPESSSFKDDEDIEIVMHLVCSTNLPDIAISCLVKNSQGVNVIHSQSDLDKTPIPVNKGVNKIVLTIPRLLLRQGDYLVTIGASIPNAYSFFLEWDVIAFKVISSNSGIMRHPESAWKGVVHPCAVAWRAL